MTARMLRLAGTILATAALAACASGPERPKPAELQPNAALIGVRLAWSVNLGAVAYPLQSGVSEQSVALAAGDGTVLVLNAANGAEVWRGSAGGPLAAGVGFDGRTAAVVTRGNELVTLDSGRVLWRQKLAAQAFTAPLVAGGRVFVLAADRSVSAFDGSSGRRLWSQTRPGDPLVLRQSGVILAVGDTLVVGLSGRLVGLNPSNGSVRWEAPVATPRGTNEIERLVDLVGRVSRVGDVVCTRAFQAAVGCVNAARGSVLWSKPSNGAEGVHGDADRVYGTEADGKVVAWRRNDGERAWMSERLQYRGLTAPLVVGRSVAIGDSAGFVHLLSRADGSLLTRLSTDGSAIAAAPVLAGNTLVVVTRAGRVYGYTPE
ncbi:MAG: outer membrane protein assembly factor BamB [Burkholderiaceae bacterium]|nr:outer membrane protein assembly factor BamB [Burkholderiaceae bacterium]MDO9090240.1 outer membrane protein assembly factor BamB [Burkholderiaceae bacterium]